MSTIRSNPYGAFNFLVALGGEQGTGAAGDIVGGFSDVSGLATEIDFADYRNGNDKSNTPHKVANVHKFEDVTLKRGVVGSTDLFDWVAKVSSGKQDTRDIDIILLDEERNIVATWHLLNAQPKKWTGPTLAAKGGTEVAMEEFVVVCEGMTFT